MYLTSLAVRSEIDTIRMQSKELARRVRRFNAPVQLALAAADAVLDSIEDPSTVTLLSQAPCCGSSAEALAMARKVRALAELGGVAQLRVNPVLTLHAVDNLALSELSIHLQNDSEPIGVGGAPGQLWVSLEELQARLASGCTREALLMAGDQDSPDAPDTAVGAAATFVATARPLQGTDRYVRLLEVREVTRSAEHAPPRAHAALGLTRLLAALQDAAPGRFEYAVPEEDGDGGPERLVARWEIT